MPYLTVASGDLLTAAQWNTNVRDQTIASCTSLTRPTSPVSGQYIYETDTLYTYYWNNTAWTLVPPTASPTFTGTPAAPTATAGTNTTQLATTAFVTTAIPALNLIINGAMQVTQRSAVGTSTSAFTLGGYLTADRYYTSIASLGTFVQTTIADAPTGSGFRNSLKMDCTVANASPAAGAIVRIIQAIEGQNLQAIRKGTASAQKLTLSFWVKSFQTGTFICELTAGSRSVSKAYTINASNTWEYKTILFPADTTTVIANDNAEGLSVTWWLGAGSTWTSGTLQTTWAATVAANQAVGQTNVASATTGEWFMTGASLTIGDADVPFQFKSFADDLRDCQRYYYRNTYGFADAIGCWHSYAVANAYGALFDHPVTMRSDAPTVGFSSRSHFLATSTSAASTYLWASGGLFANANAAFNTGAAFTGAGFTVGSATIFQCGTANGYIDVSAEL